MKIYLDDILIFSENHEKHQEHVETVLKILSKNKIAINFEKSQFFAKYVTFLGQEVTAEGIKPNLIPLNKLNLDKKMRSKKDIMKFVGTLQWFRAHVPNLSAKLSAFNE